MPYLNDCLSATHFSFCQTLDHDEAKKHHNKPCPVCGLGILHWANYPRKPRIPNEVTLPDGFDIQFSLCCSKEGCRKRFNPPTVRFAGGSSYPAAIIVLVKILRSGPSSARISQLKSLMDIDERTIRRWLAKWRKTENTSPWWRKIASKHFLSGQGMAGLWDFYSKNQDNIKSLQIIIQLCRDLWKEWINDGGSSHAEFAG